MAGETTSRATREQREDDMNGTTSRRRRGDRAAELPTGTELDAPPTLLPGGWAAILYLYGLR